MNAPQLGSEPKFHEFCIAVQFSTAIFYPRQLGFGVPWFEGLVAVKAPQ